MPAKFVLRGIPAKFVGWAAFFCAFFSAAAGPPLLPPPLLLNCEVAGLPRRPRPATWQFKRRGGERGGIVTSQEMLPAEDFDLKVCQASSRRAQRCGKPPFAFKGDFPPTHWSFGQCGPNGSGFKLV